MKILLIPSSSSDYLQDSIYLGFKDLFGTDVECTLNCEYLYKNVTINPHNMWGMGFTYTNILDENLNNLASNVLDKVSQRYYDLIIYTFISRNNAMISDIMEITNGKNVVLINGEDENWRFEEYNEKVFYFKRELVEKKEKNIFPIGYSIHKSKLYQGKKHIEKEISFSVPSMDNCTPTSSSKYIFETEKDYYRDYQISKFGLTRKKGGWDSMRHYEILANKSIPIFENIDFCPDFTLTNLPKKLLSEVEKKYRTMSDSEYQFYLDELFGFTEQFLTTDKSVQQLLNIILN